MKGKAGVLLFSGVVLLALAGLGYSYGLCNPSGSGCYLLAARQFGILAPLIFAPGALLLIASIYLQTKGLRRANRQG